MEEPALGASADALASQGIGTKSEPSPDLPKDLQFSPEVTKRPLEPTDDQENGDTKRPRLDEETVHDDSVMDMDLDLDAMVQDVLGDIDNQMSKFGGLHSVQDADMMTRSIEPAVVQEPPEPAATIISDPTKAIQFASLPSLTNFAFQVLLILANESLPDLPAAIREKDSETSLSWNALKLLFTQTRAVFSKSGPLLQPHDNLDHINADERRIADLASLCCSLTSSGPAADSDERYELYKSFFATVLRPGAELSQGTANLFVAVKTQAIIDSVARGVQEKPIDQLIEEAFPSDLDQQLMQRREVLELTDIERSLVTTAQQRREELLSHIASGQNESQLRTTYDVEELFRLVNTYLRNELQVFADIALRYAVRLPQPVDEEAALDEGVSEMDENALESLLQATDGLVAQYLPNGGVEDASISVVPTTEDNVTMTDSQAAATDAPTANAAPTTNGTTTAESALPDHHDLLAEIDLQTQEYVRTTLSNLSPAPYQPTVPQPTGVSLAHTPYLSHIQQAQQAQQAQQQAQQAQQSQQGLQAQQTQQHHQQHHQQATHYYGYAHDPTRATLGDESAPLPPSQSLPSSVLYDRARQAALSKNTNPQRREGGSSTRRPWSQEEEKALMMGLDKVQGPHWSQILSLYGVGGSVSNILKDRSQVQLKDKARNLKLFFLKSNSEMPYYLQAVTGELKTRAPSQAARKEAEEKARQNSEEAQVRSQHGFPMAHQALQASPHGHQKSVLPNHHALHALQQATQAMSPQTGTTSGAPPLLPASTPIHQALAPSPATVSAIASAASQANKTEHVPLAPQPAPVSAAPQAPSTPTTAAATPYLPQASQTPHQIQPPVAHTPTAHTPVQSYTPTHSYTPPQPAPMASPHIQTAPSAEPAVSMPQEDLTIKSEPAPLAEQAPTEPTSLYGLDEHDDLKDAALMQSLRELEAYSGTSVS